MPDNDLSEASASIALGILGGLMIIQILQRVFGKKNPNYVNASIQNQVYSIIFLIHAIIHQTAVSPPASLLFFLLLK